MIQTVRVETKLGPDLKGEGVLNEINNISKNAVEKVTTTRIYRLEGINEQQAKFLSEKLLCEPINQSYSLNKNRHSGDERNEDSRISTRNGFRPCQNDKSHTIEIAYKPGVMNPQVASIIKAAKDLGIQLKAADVSFEYEFFGKILKEELLKLIEKLNLFNKTVEHIVEKEPQTLLIKGSIGETAIIPLRKMNEKELLELSKDKLFLNLEELKVIQNYFSNLKRDITDVELETVAQTWSEHCAHKTFKAKLIVDGKQKEPLMSRIKKEALKHKKNIVSAFVDNSGVMDFYDGFAICAKAETHNSPSAIEPYGGAMTGSGGVFRDVVATGFGAKTLVSTDIFCLGNPDMDKKDLPDGCLPPDYILKRVVAAVKDYGNRMGIPTTNGSFHFHNDFRAKPTVLVGAYGILPKKYAKKGQAKKGDLVIALGGRTGRDGIHGATFSSSEMTDQTIQVNSSAVQIGNAIEEKRMFDAVLDLRDAGCIRAIQDCGAGGFSSAIGEMGEKVGVTVDLSKAPLKYQGLSPWEIWVSESQERMVLAVPKQKLKTLEKICKKYNTEFSLLGHFDGSKKLHIFYGKEKVCDLDMDFLHNGLPQRTMEAFQPNRHSGDERNEDSRIKKGTDSGLARMTNSPPSQKEWIEILKIVLSDPNVNSKEPVVRLYDHSVQGTAALMPFAGEHNDGPNDSSVINPLLNKPYGMIVAHGLNPVLNNFDPYYGSLWSAVEALSNYVAVGGNYKDAALINNYVWPFPDKESLWSLDKSVDAVVDVMKIFNIPVISGKDSLSSTYRGKDRIVIKIPPVLCISVFGKIKDVSKTVSSDFKKENTVICLVGNMDFENMAGSVYMQIVNRHCADERSEDSRISPMNGFWINQNDRESIPHVDIKNLPKIFDSIFLGIQNGNILSCHDISEGGLITTLFEMCVGGNVGCSVVILNLFQDLRSDYFLFNETAGNFLVEIENEETAKKIFKNIPYKIIGKTQQQKIISVFQNKKLLFNARLDELKKSWQEPMRKVFT